MTPLPKPRCLDYDLQRRDMDLCCDLLFNDTVADETNANYEYYSVDFNHYSDYMDYKDDLRHEIRQNYTKTECQLSMLHQPADSLSITPFDPDFCCSFGFCLSEDAGGVPLSFVSAKE